MKKILFGLLLAFVSLGIVKNTYAVSDYSFTIPSNFTGSQSFSPCSQTDCSSYKYIVFENFSGNFNSNVWVSATFSSVNFCMIRPIYTTSLICEFNTSGNPSISVNNWDFGFSADVRLTESISSGGGSTPSPEPEPCPEPVIPDCDEPFIVRLFEGSFWNIATACVGIFVSILALFLVFRLIHGLIYGKGV